VYFEKFLKINIRIYFWFVKETISGSFQLRDLMICNRWYFFMTWLFVLDNNLLFNSFSNASRNRTSQWMICWSHKKYICGLKWIYSIILSQNILVQYFIFNYRQFITATITKTFWANLTFIGSVHHPKQK